MTVARTIKILLISLLALIAATIWRGGDNQQTNDDSITAADERQERQVDGEGIEAATSAEGKARSTPSPNPSNKTAESLKVATEPADPKRDANIIEGPPPEDGLRTMRMVEVEVAVFSDGQSVEGARVGLRIRSIGEFC